MSITYSVLAGDTFESIARKKYGTEQESYRIAAANPGVSEPLSAGTTITVPTLPDAPENVPQAAASSADDEVAILVDGKRFRFWDQVRIVRSLDAMDMVEFGAPFDSELPGFKDTFRPFSFKTVVITVGGTPLFTGTMVSVNPVIGNDRKTVSVSGYSLPGVLNDCTPPASAFPLEYDGQGLREIATALAAPFGLTVDFQAEPGAIFERVAIEPGKRILTFLAELAKQRKLVISSTPLGKLVFLRSVETGTPVARLQQGQPPILSITPFFSPQEYYSHITGMESVVMGLAGSQFTVKNPRLTGVTRPLTFGAPDTLDADVKSAVEAKVGRMFGNMVSYSVRVSTWRDPSGELWAPNTLIQLLAPDAMIYAEYKFVIRSVEFNRDRASETATLNLVIPGAFSGKIPEGLPWDD